MLIRRALVGLTLLSALLHQSMASADTVTVRPDCSGSGCYATIREGLQRAAHNDTVLVHPGTYSENITIGDLKTATLVSLGGKEVTIIDGGGRGRVLSMSSNEYIGTFLLDGFTIRNGYSSGACGGIRALNKATIKNCRITGNVSEDKGGGICLISNTTSAVQTIMDNCVVDNNRAAHGGGVYADWGATIKNSVIRNNLAHGGSGTAAYGGGLYDGANSGFTVIQNSTFTENTASNGENAYGGAISTADSAYYHASVTIDDSEISGNIAYGGSGSGYGGGIHGNGWAQIKVTNTTVKNNRALCCNWDAPSPGHGGGLYCDQAHNIKFISGGWGGNTPNAHEHCTTGCLPDEIEDCQTTHAGACLPGERRCGPAGWLACMPTAPYCPSGEASSANYRFSAVEGDPVNTFKGEIILKEPHDLYLGGPMKLKFRRYYASKLLKDGKLTSPLGKNWLHNFDMRLRRGGEVIEIITPQGRSVNFVKVGAEWILVGKKDVAYKLDESGGFYTMSDPIDGVGYILDTDGKLVAVKDGKGNVLTLSYLGGLLKEVSDGLGRALSFSYDQNALKSVSDGTRTVAFENSGGDLTACTGATGGETRYTLETGSLMAQKTYPTGEVRYTQTFDAQERVVKQVDADGSITTFDYNDQGFVTTVIDPNGKIHRYRYNEKGELIAFDGQDARSFYLSYDASGQRSEITDRYGKKTTYTYDPYSGKLATVTNADGSVTRYSYFTSTSDGVIVHSIGSTTFPDGSMVVVNRDASGNAVSVQDQMGKLWTYIYNDKGQKVTATDPEGGQWQYNYDSQGNLVSRTSPAGNGATYLYDTQGRLHRIIQPDGNAKSYRFDEKDNITAITDYAGRTTTLTYNSSETVSSVTDTLGNITKYKFNDKELVTEIIDAEGKSQHFEYDPLGKLSTHTDQLGQKTTYKYDDRGNRTAITNAGGKTWTRRYDPEGILLSETDPMGNTTYYTSDDMGRITDWTTPEGNKTSMTFNKMGQVSRVVNPEGEVTSYEYYPNGKLKRASFAGDTIVMSYLYNSHGQILSVTDGIGEIWTRSYDSSGRMSSRTDPLGNITTYDYNNMDRLSRIHLPGVGNATADLTYDKQGLLVRRSYSDGTVQTYQYDAGDLLISSENINLGYDRNGRVTYSNGITITRRADGRIADTTLAVNKKINYEYDQNNRLTHVKDWNSGDISFDYDDAGRLTTITRPNGVNTTYTYNKDGKVTNITEGTLAATTIIRDKKGQIIEVDCVGAACPFEPALDSATMSYDKASQLSSAQYDAAGRRVSDQTTAYTWNDASRLKSTTAVTDMEYDGLGHLTSCKRMNQPDTHYGWNHGYCSSSVDIEHRDGSDWMYYVHTPAGELLNSVKASDDSRQYYHFDVMGNTMFLTDDNGNVTVRYAYSPYGIMTASNALVHNPFTFQGLYGAIELGDDGIYYMKARYYDANTGSFISRNPKHRTTPKAVNPYVYAIGNPMMYSNPMGLGHFPMLDDLDIHIAPKLHSERQAVSEKGPRVADSVMGMRIRKKERPKAEPTDPVPEIKDNRPKSDLPAGTKPRTPQDLPEYNPYSWRGNSPEAERVRQTVQAHIASVIKDPDAEVMISMRFDENDQVHYVYFHERCTTDSSGLGNRGVIRFNPEGTAYWGEFYRDGVRCGGFFDPREKPFDEYEGCMGRVQCLKCGYYRCNHEQTYKVPNPTK